MSQNLRVQIWCDASPKQAEPLVCAKCTPAVEVTSEARQGDTMIYVLAFPEFAPQVAQKIDKFRARHEPDRAQLVDPHVTLVFGVAVHHKECLKNLCATIAQDTHAFRVSFDRFEARYDPFEQKHKIFLICGDGAQTVTALHKDLYDGPHQSELYQDHPYEPHMTVATHPDRAHIDGLDKTDIQQELPITGTIRAIELVELSNGALTTLETYSLKAS